MQITFHQFQFTVYTFPVRGKSCWSSTMYKKNPRKILLPNHLITASPERVPKSKEISEGCHHGNITDCNRVKVEKHVCTVIDKQTHNYVALESSAQSSRVTQIRFGERIFLFILTESDYPMSLHTNSNCYGQLTNKQQTFSESLFSFQVMRVHKSKCPLNKSSTVRHTSSLL